MPGLLVGICWGKLCSANVVSACTRACCGGSSTAFPTAHLPVLPLVGSTASDGMASAPESLWIPTPSLHFVAGAVGGTVAAGVTCPLDVVKTRLQSSMLSSLRSMRPHQVAADIVRTEGCVDCYAGDLPGVPFASGCTSACLPAPAPLRPDRRPPCDLPPARLDRVSPPRVSRRRSPPSATPPHAVPCSRSPS